MAGRTPVKVIGTVEEMRAQAQAWRRAGERIALVPTMGALHEGHLSLVRLARQHAERVVTSIFVNPTQFAPNEDFDKYPRTEEDDLDLLASVNGDVAWLPGKTEMYPDAFATRIVPAGAAEGLETEFRPQFFNGVATVCCKLFGQVTPDVAVFGEKDYQQLAVIRQMVRDLNLPLTIIGAPTVREADGLAMSSRNRYLSAEERALATAIFAAMSDVARAIDSGSAVAAAVAPARAALEAKGFRVDYLDVRDAETLTPVDAAAGRPLRVLVAAWLGKTRLIDNMAVGVE